MWPKAIAQLIELLPHMARLLPMADRFLQSKTSDTDASGTALTQIAEGLRSDLGQVTAAHAGLYRSLNEQSEKLTRISSDQRAAEASLQSMHVRMTAIERSVRSLFRVIIVASVVLFSLLLLLILRHR